MTPEQKLKYVILDVLHQWENDEPIRDNMSGDEVDELFDDSDVTGAFEEVRTSGISTGLPCPHDRHYETEAVAHLAPNGEWVGFTYWYGGGKHGDPESIDWIEHAYDVTCIEEKRMMTVQTFQGVGQE